ncbi:uncharacterized protein EV420DRAFT_1723100 [Desarmillaria tabescens]|uniref:Uncharacterized protein n=1 Tax=Armillaria tabescens TaxID=1929756 RepID=A0AA39MRT2_ARMTA|nr:uncharacterized protein EV420DRAFT_1723100 [Desarmillaria tabescens]KAK0443883.1 hypothetical protein EV420DRAFT_1723100 [Desarmillaria tabescens]
MSGGCVEKRVKPTKAGSISRHRWHHSVRSVPVFPLEIIELIICEAWNLLLSTKAREAFRRASMHVSHAWMATFMRVSLADLRITNYNYFVYVWWFLRGGNSIACKHLDIQSYLGNCCRSITFYSTLATTVADITLRHVHLKYNNRLSLDPYDHWYRFHYFPTTVTDLEITHIFDDDFRDFPESMFVDFWARHIRPHDEMLLLEKPWRLPHVRRLTVRGGHVPLVLTIASRAEGLEEITTDVDSEQVIKGLQHLDLSHLRVARCSPPVQGVESQVVTLERRLKKRL